MADETNGTFNLFAIHVEIILSEEPSDSETLDPPNVPIETSAGKSTIEQDGANIRLTHPQSDAPSTESVKTTSSTANPEKVLEAVFRASSRDSRLFYLPSPLTRHSTSSIRPGFTGWVRSIPINFLQTFNIVDPVPVDYGPAPSTLPLHEQPRVRGLSDTYESPLILLK
jgi:hypothetical protein